MIFELWSQKCIFSECPRLEKQKQTGPKQKFGMSTSHSMKSITVTNDPGLLFSTSDLKLDFLNEALPHLSLPAPQQLYSRNPCGKLCAGKILVEANFPHKILAVSKGLRDTLQFLEEHIFEQRIDVICGPETDKMALLSSIKQAVDRIAGESQALPLRIYGWSGVAHSVKVSCSCQEQSDVGTVVSCCLLLEMDTVNDERFKKAAKPSMFGSRRGSLPSTRAECRARYNFLTGLEIQRELLSKNNSNHPIEGINYDMQSQVNNDSP